MLDEVDLRPLARRQPLDPLGRLPPSRDDDVGVGHVGGGHRPPAVDHLVRHRHAVEVARLLGRQGGRLEAVLDQLLHLLFDRLRAGLGRADDGDVVALVLKDLGVDRGDADAAGEAGEREPQVIFIATLPGLRRSPRWIGTWRTRTRSTQSPPAGGSRRPSRRGVLSRWTHASASSVSSSATATAGAAHPSARIAYPRIACGVVASVRPNESDSSTLIFVPPPK